MDQSVQYSTDNELQKLKNVLSELPQAIEIKLKVGEVFNSIHHRMIQGQDYEVILDSVFNSLDNVIPFDRIGIALLENNDKIMANKWVRSKLPIREIDKKYKADISRSSLKSVIENKRPRIISDLQKYLDEHPESQSTRLILKDGIRSSLTCPLIHNDEAIGCIFFSSSKPNTYSNVHVEIFMEISLSLSLIIEQALMKKSLAENQFKEKIFRSTIHDLNNPLAVIKATLELLIKKEWFNDLNDNLKKSFLTLKRNSEAMINMVNEIAEVNKLISPTTKIKIRRVKLSDFLLLIHSDSTKLGSQKNIKVRMHKSEHLPEEASFDALYIKRAMENLISNSIKYSRPHTTILIKIDVDDNRLIFSVIDEGLGIPSDEHCKLFKEFGKTSVRPTSGESSSGLGLASVKRIIEAHHGDISVQSEVDVGSTFSFWIPVHPLH